MGKIMSEQVSANVDVKPEQPAPEKKKVKKSWLRKINPLLLVTVVNADFVFRCVLRTICF